MNVEYLLDASALYGLVAHYRRWVGRREKLAILHLTVYEVGNALWKEARAGRLPLREAAGALSRVLSSLKMLDDPPLERVLEVAVERDLTFYDASYAYVAETLGLSLVTQDRKLLRKSPAAIDVDTFLARL
ncbi:putative nucleic acid-binding protein, contains PIN domain [Pyrobaculum sp. WP30]|nr:putative nucleic acid-binding protein, contains PIN domain [Pyrobaculum sp. WP30]